MYTVIWIQNALDDLARTWTNADAIQRAKITMAADRIENELQSNPDSVGESRPRGRRIAFQPPVAILFEVHAEQRTVVILHFWTYRKKA